jgi:glycosyltransferase involved in cell wall biosynthesis
VSAVAAPTVRVLGGTTERTAYAVVNREWHRALVAAGCRLVDDDTADVLLHHDYSTRFGDTDLPPARRRVAARPWDFGPYPPRWVDVVEQQYDELWVWTEWERDCARRSGLTDDRIRVVPLGVDVDAFAPAGPVHPLTEEARHTFLFVGAAIGRKGIDVLLAAFLDTFNHHDDVQLVIKDHTGDVFYEGASERDAVLGAARTPGAPRIHYIDDYVPQAELAALYRGASALVHPARAEGWALPVLEAMACGTPAVVPEFGPFLDFCDPSAARFVAVRRIRAPIRREFTVNTLGYREHVDGIDFCEPHVASVSAALREITTWTPRDVAARRAAARANAERWTWAHAAETMVQAVRELADDTT